MKWTETDKQTNKQQQQQQQQQQGKKIKKKCVTPLNRKLKR